MKKIILLVTTVVLFHCLSACNTIKGVGKDIEKGGEAIQRVAK
ncbi:MAG: entericidin A/B family lipoprotein [Dissulfuribacterales bacterium]